MKYIVDTNVPLVANGAAPQASALCASICARRLVEISKQHLLVIDDGWHILNEYKHKLRSSGQPGVGDAFLKWVLTNWANPQRCEMVHITLQGTRDEQDFAELPRDPALAGLDPSDRKFVVVVAVAHGEHPPILNAVDSDWWEYRQALARHHVQVECIYPDALFMQGD